MNHFISGIIKIILLEASVGLLLIDRLAADRYERARYYAFTGLAALAVFAWANYFNLRSGAGSWLFVASAVPLVLVVGWVFRVGVEGLSAGPPRWAMDLDATFVRWLARVLSKWQVAAAFAALGLIVTSTNAARVAQVLGAAAVYGAAALLHWALTGAKVPLARVRTIAVALFVGWPLLWVWAGHQAGAIPLVHQWEQYHFYLGAKYQKEVGWFDLYKATVIADREGVNALGPVQTVREIADFETIPVDKALEEAPRIKAKFTPARWEAFKQDWAAMARTWPMDWGRVVNDHGNSNSPAWALLAHPIAELVPLSAENQSYLGWIDMLLMLFLWLFVYQTFGWRAASVGLIFWALPPNSWEYLSGSFLRWDWLFAIGMATCFLKRGRWGLAGAFFGFAAATKLFPIFFGVALLVRAGFDWWSTRKVRPEWLRFLKGAAIAGAVVVAASTAVFGTDAWVEYYRRIQVAQVEKWYAIQYSLKTVYLQVAESRPGELVSGWYFPAEMKQARPDVDIKDHAFGFLVARLLFTALIVLLIRRAGDVEAFTLGPLLVFTWLTVNMYYWNMLGLLALGLALRKERPALGLLAGLHAIFMSFYVYQHTNRGASEGYAVAVLLCALIVLTALWEWLDTRPRPAGAKADEPAATKP